MSEGTLMTMLLIFDAVLFSYAYSEGKVISEIKNSISNMKIIGVILSFMILAFITITPSLLTSLIIYISIPTLSTIVGERKFIYNIKISSMLLISMMVLEMIIIMVFSLLSGLGGFETITINQRAVLGVIAKILEIGVIYGLKGIDWNVLGTYFYWRRN